MAATTPLMNSSQFQHKNPNHISAVARGNLTCAVQLCDGPTEGPRLRVAFQGIRGAYSESAAKKGYPNCEAGPWENFEDCFEAVESWRVDRAVLPIENSTAGSIHRNYDLLCRHNCLHIVGEVYLPVIHCLLANHSVKVEDLKSVLSHPQALSQCENTLTKLGLRRESVHDTAWAAKYVAEHKLMDVGAVASVNAAKIYGLNILTHGIQDFSDNITRFVMIAREPIIPATDKPYKTSIVFSLEEGPGKMFKVLAVFENANINLTKIKSRPAQKQTLRTLGATVVGSHKHFKYLFYIDFEASMAENRAQVAIDQIKEFATYFRVLGSYPADNSLQ